MFHYVEPCAHCDGTGGEEYEDYEVHPYGDTYAREYYTDFRECEDCQATGMVELEPFTTSEGDAMTVLYSKGQEQRYVAIEEDEEVLDQHARNESWNGEVQFFTKGVSGVWTFRHVYRDGRKVVHHG